ncbi:bifunctional tRNA (5-methylaminomethyl-2-thiouridine)(34)-methyltransferase MnmD/FAD-dependent 5-carboxymethylaminomethyl-2-thiouridine(34) oxidoreductase MnmC [Terricaulis silvestris]|uniref:tRNA 5-methylaminomethyl-2-thiouridine biosynthesis bifunctional protein MnmC n=1 Tax=Terricaulis silvestris TaxID=2686094 RepID=A0A6I6MRA5_9CAUL|nr:bifunctional tRNA (5-methylaminomethyl-2-thiouridine)(34)-methyltransferase MnmD/FAD-dependent 5-carboxymethylaminomethyl-2-thiouridine(34) oxidoreductase MnmC [Terricaulis silvestris]QGZ94152.1 tRNA 5-methylaminomethyl-2-thiouridine biosynthesis bifunctional protein MnmC [Terricaulis silvestris]
MTRLPPSPELAWSEEGVPTAAAFNDVYFSKAGGLAEAEAVFLAGCGLPDAWKCKDRFAIAELGFGTGLNVLAAWRAWKKTRLPHAILHISTIEAFPLAREDAARSLAHFPEVAALATALLERWPVRAYAPQRLWFPEDGFALTVFTGEAETILAGLHGRFDAWFLDGFAPARNQAMWSEAIVRHVGRLSNPGARLATFTVAGAVRRRLESAGFAVEKKPGFGAKRERLEATLKPTLSLAERVAAQRPGLRHAEAASAAQAGEGRSDEQAPDRVQASLYPYAPANPARVAILGAGIAGAACAEALTRRGVEAIVLDAAPTLGDGASGNPAGLVMPRLDRGGGPLAELFLAAYLSAIAAYERLGVFTPCGVEQRADAEGALADLLNDPSLPSDWFAPHANGALHPRAGLVDPQAAIAAMLRGAELQLEAPVTTIERSGDAWILRAPDGRALLKADAVILACGPALKQFAPASFLPITLSRGQIEWGEGTGPPHAITDGAYVAPFNRGILFGATFDRAEDPTAPEPSTKSRARNLEALSHLAPAIAASVHAATLRSRAALRATTPDRAPIVGLLPDAEAWLVQYADLAHGRAITTTAPPPAHRGVYVIGGLGARGLTLAPLLAERLASEICNEPMPLSQAALDAVHPARFLHRSLKRR